MAAFPTTWRPWFRTAFRRNIGDAVFDLLTAISGGTVTADTISEQTSAAGVTVDGCLIKDGRVAKINGTTGLKIITEATGTGSAQDVAHGMGLTPAQAVIVFTELPSALAAGADGVVNSLGATNINVTVTNGIKFVILAVG